MTESIKEKAERAIELASMATTGPWKSLRTDVGNTILPNIGYVAYNFNADFISSSRELLPELAKEVLRLLDREYAFEMAIKHTKARLEQAIQSNVTRGYRVILNEIDQVLESPNESFVIKELNDD